jgi:DNA-binding transcriptional ArsR family regulator
MSDSKNGDLDVSGVAAAIGEPARARILFCLMDGRARTGTELTVVAEVGPSTASVHLNRLERTRLVKMVRQGRNRYYSLRGLEVASALEGLSVLAAAVPDKFVSSTPHHLRAARSCYDHIAGSVGVSILDRFAALGWLTATERKQNNDYDVTREGAQAFQDFGIDLDAARALRRRFACGCLDWSERRFHLAGALGAAFLTLARKRKWVVQDQDSRALRITDRGRRDIFSRIGVPA